MSKVTNQVEMLKCQNQQQMLQKTKQLSKSWLKIKKSIENYWISISSIIKQCEKWYDRNKAETVKINLFKPS